MNYSFKKGAAKGLQAIIVVGIAVLSSTAVGGLDLGAFVQEHVVPMLSGVTVVGALTMLLNYIKVKYS